MLIYLIIFLMTSEYVLAAGNPDMQYLSEDINNILQQADTFLHEFNKEAIEMCNRVATIEWKYSLNTTEYNRRRLKEQNSISTKFECISWSKANAFNVSRLPETDIKRKLERIIYQGKCGLDEKKYLELFQIIGSMKEKYNNGRLCPFRARSTIISQDSCNLRLDPDLIRIMEISRNELELKYIWEGWREQIGPPLRNSFMRYIDLVNQAARINGFPDAGYQMRAIYDDPELYFTVQDLWTKIQPLYKQLFTFVRRGLIRLYGNQVIRDDGPIPAHLFNNMWGQNWKNLMDVFKPSHNTAVADTTGEIIRQGYTPMRFFQAAEEFFTSMGLPPMPPEFWRNSVLYKNVTNTRCAPSAWDFCNNVDFRIMQCTRPTIEDFVSAHHEMAHIQYYMHYTNQPFIYREGPNPAYHEAIADSISLCVGGPVHLQRIGLLGSSVVTSNGNSAVNIEYLLGVALEKLPFMSYSLALEKWRWNIFEKGPFKMNSKWWSLRLRYQGIIPPGQRSMDSFDAAAKYQIISDDDYIKYFIASVIQFQLFAELCQVSGHIGPLHTCDFYRSREAGRILSEVMQHGASISSSQLIKIITKGRTARISADYLLEFFRPLEAWLEQQNYNESVIGWNSNMEDLELFQTINSGCHLSEYKILFGFIVSVFVVLN